MTNAVIPKRSITPGVQTVRLADVDPLTEKLVDSITKSSFDPDLIVYIETGARLLAASLHRKMRIPALPIVIRRRGSATKARYSSLLRSVPTPVLDFLRDFERRRNSSAASIRVIEAAPEADLRNKRVLIVDDAADSGESLTVAGRWAMAKGAAESEIRYATISVTQSRACDLVSFWIYSQLCRFPWSSDSAERQQYLSLYEQIDPGQLAAGDI